MKYENEDVDMIIKLGTSMYITTKSGIFLIRCQFIEYKAPIIDVSCTTVLYGTVKWTVGGAIYQTYSKDLLLLHWLYSDNGYDEITCWLQLLLIL